MLRRFTIFMLFAISSCLAFECRITATSEQEKLKGMLEGINNISSRAEKSVDAIFEKVRAGAIHFVDTKISDLKKMRKIEFESDLCEINYLNKMLSDTLDKIHCCVKTHWELFDKMTLFGIPQRGEDLMADLDTVCSSTTSTKDWITFSLQIKKGSVAKLLKYSKIVKANKNPMIPLIEAVETCTSKTHQDLIDLINVNFNRSEPKKLKDCTYLEKSLNWEERPQC